MIVKFELIWVYYSATLGWEPLRHRIL